MAQITLNSSGVASDGSLLLQSNGTTTAVTINTAQNMGLGVTPNTWTTFKALQLPGGAFASTSGQTAILNNAYLDTTFKYTASGVAASYADQFSGAHRWFSAASGTAGNTISFTQAMTLDASGNLGIGMTPSSTVRFDVSGPASSWGIRTRGGGNAGIPIASFADVNGAGEVRIDSSGNLLVGATSAHNFGIPSIQAGGSNANAIISVRRDTTSAADQILFYNPNGVVGSISTSGSLTSYNVASDQRLKENIVDAPEFGSVIDSIQVRSFDWKTDQTHQRAGFIAQELVTIAPEAVYQPEDTDRMMAVDYSKLVPMLVKEIQSLRVRVAQLETN
jgi:hypothetical protein